MKKLTVCIILLYATTTHAQEVVTDPPNEGQLKRMVYDQWDDWQISPYIDVWLIGTIPNPAGMDDIPFYWWAYWTQLHGEYYDGEDRRPYRDDGPFVQNYASLTLQDMDDQKIMDSTNNLMQTNLATYVNMSGGPLDVSYYAYFQNALNGLLGEVPGILQNMAVNYPKAYTAITNTDSLNNFLEFLTVEQDRISALNNAFCDKGDRITGYLGIEQELRQRNKTFEKLLDMYVLCSAYPSVGDVNTAQKNTTWYNNDAQIITHILATYQF